MLQVWENFSKMAEALWGRVSSLRPTRESAGVSQIPPAVVWGTATADNDSEPFDFEVWHLVLAVN